MELVAIGIPLIGGAIWLTKRPSLTWTLYAVSAFFAALADGWQHFKRQLAKYLGDIEGGAA